MADANKFIPYDDMYQDVRTSAEIASDSTLSVTDLKTRKQDYFKKKIKEKLYLNETAIETKLYEKLEDDL